jgi:predicted anti-sigma-YlaC factor YlaD
MMNCKKATQLLSEAQDRELSLTDRAALKIHVMMCSGCSNFSQQLNLLRSFTRNYNQGNDASSCPEYEGSSSGDRNKKTDNLK